MQERQTGFRLGESAGKPWGGNVPDEPFPKALQAFAAVRGFESQSAFARSLGKRGPGTVRNWFIGKSTPIPEEMSRIFLLHKPTPEEVESLIGSWSILWQEGKGIKGGSKIARSHIKLSKTPLGMWIEQYTKDRQISLLDLSEKVGVQLAYRDKLGIASMQKVIDRADEVLGLDEMQVAELIEACAQTIEQRVAEGHQFKTNVYAAKAAQKDLACKTFTPTEAARELVFTREAVRQHRKKLGLPLLITEKQLEILRQSFEETRELRERSLAGKRARQAGR